MKLRKIEEINLYIRRLKVKTAFFSAVFTMLMFGNAVASDISALNFNGDLIGKVIPDGTVVNSKSEVIGK